MNSPSPNRSQRWKASSFMVASGIFLSRIFGLIRDRILAHYLGNSDANDAFRAAFRIQNFLQNMFGEGVLSASFIPVYARLNANGEKETATEVAEAVFSILFLVTSVIVFAGIVAAPWLIDVIAPGFSGPKRLLTIQLIRILFPGAALLVLSAWCLGILNSHRKFFLSYAAPVVWNLAIITALIWKGNTGTKFHLAAIVAEASVAGSALQFLLQLPTTLKFLRPLRKLKTLRSSHVNVVIKNFFPVFVSRGVVQISAFVDTWLASFLPTGAVSALAYSQTLSALPVSLFGMSVSAAELPAMSSELGAPEEIATALRSRLQRGLQQIAYFVVPSVIGFVCLGDVIVAAIYRTGAFNAHDVTYVWIVLAGAGIGLLASTSGRLYSSAFYALRDTRTPLKFAIIRVSLTLILGYLCALKLPPFLHIDHRWGVAGLTASAGVAGWLEFVLLRREMHIRIGVVPYSLSRLLMLWLAAIAAAAVGFTIKVTLPFHSPILVGACVLMPYGAIYLLLTWRIGAENIRGLRKTK